MLDFCKSGYIYTYTIMLAYNIVDVVLRISIIVTVLICLFNNTCCQPLVNNVSIHV